MALTKFYKKAFIAAWGIYSIIGTIAVVVAIFVPADTVMRASPTCYSVKQFGKQCFMCGSTRSFIQAGHGHFVAAAHYNRLALALFFAFIINAILFIYFFITNHLKHKNQ